MAADRERLQVTELVRRKIGELRAPPEQLTFRAIEKLWRVSAAHIANLHNRKTSGVVGPELENRVAELYFGGSVDDLRREARKIDLGSDVRASVVAEPLERYPNLEAAARFAIQAAGPARRPYVEQAVAFYRTAALQAESDPSPDRWLLDIREKADELRRDALEPERVREREDADQARADAAAKVGRAGWGKGRKGS